MKIKCHNIGKISDADIDIHKITLIAGLNSTGKSTVGKSLFCLFNALYDYERKISRVKKNFIINKFSRSMRMLPSGKRSIEDSVIECANILVDENIQGLERIQQVVNNTIPFKILENASTDTVNEIADFLKTTNQEFVEWFLSDLLDNEFHKQIQTSNRSPEESSITLTIQQQEIFASLINNEVNVFRNTEILNTRAIYVDDPFVLDTLDNPFWGVQHQQELIRRLKDKTSDDSDGIAQKFVINKKLSKIFEKISSACDGSIVRKDQEFSFQERTTGESLNVKNLSTGLKSFIIIKMLLENGSLEQNGTLILDEPEVHLHPEWQKIFAEVIVLIQKEFGMHILINSHSSYFIEAIDFYEQKYGIRNACKFYLAKEMADTRMTHFEDVSNQLQPIYKLLYAPVKALIEEQHYVDEESHND